MALIFGNFAISSIAAPLGPSDTSMTVALGTGSLFPSPTGAEYFVLVLTDVATKSNHEVVWCTARSGDNLTIARAKEGTTAQSWIVSDLCYNGPTNGQMAAMAQLAGAAFTGEVTVITQSTSDNTTKAASTAFARAAATSISNAGIAGLGIDTSAGRQSLDGYVEAWGIYTGDSSGTTQTVDFSALVTMSTSVYDIKVTRLTRGGGAIGTNDVPTVGGQTTTSFDLGFGSSVDSSWTYSWRIKGAGVFA